MSLWVLLASLAQFLKTIVLKKMTAALTEQKLIDVLVLK